MKSEKGELPNEESIRALGKKKNYKDLGISESDTIKQKEMKEKRKNKYVRKPRSFSKQQKSHQKDIHISSSLCKILRNNLQIDTWEIYTNGAKYRKVDDS